MDGRGIGEAMDGLMRLAAIGFVAITIGLGALVIGVPIAIWWAVNHIEIKVIDVDKADRSDP